MKVNKSAIAVICTSLVVLYLIPLIYTFVMPQGGMIIAMFILFILNPIFYFGSSVFLTRLEGFNWFIELLKIILFIPTVYIYYNSSAFAYVIPYCIINLVGIVIGQVLYVRKMKNIES